MLENRKQLQFLMICFVILVFGCFTHADMKVKVYCFGDEFKLECPLMNVLLVHLTSLSVPPPNSTFCNDGNTFLVPCDLLSYSDSLKRRCSGRRKCIFGKNAGVEAKQNCRTKYIITIVYECKPIRVNATAKAVTYARTTEMFKQTQTTMQTKMRPGGAGNETQEGSKVNSVTCLFYTLFSATMALQYMQGRPKHLILCFVLSISAGIVILMIAVLLMACIEKIIEESRRKTSTAVEISLPLLITPSNVPEAAAQIESTQTSEAGSGQREVTTLPRIHSIRRCHSVDEGTQTEPEADDLLNVDNGITDNEAKELGYLVDIMRYYNSNLDNMPSSNEPFSLRLDGLSQREVETPTETGSGSGDTARARSEHVYTGPRIVDTSRRRQPRLSSATYSSSNNSENGDTSLFLSTASAKHNHINSKTPSISTLPRRRPYLNAKHDSLTHTPTSLHNNNSPMMQNGPRTRVIGRTRFAGESPSLGRQYGTLS